MVFARFPSRVTGHSNKGHTIELQVPPHTLLLLCNQDQTCCDASPRKYGTARCQFRPSWKMTHGTNPQQSVYSLHSLYYIHFLCFSHNLKLVYLYTLHILHSFQFIQSLPYYILHISHTPLASPVCGARLLPLIIVINLSVQSGSHVAACNNTHFRAKRTNQRRD